MNRINDIQISKTVFIGLVCVFIVTLGLSLVIQNQKLAVLLMIVAILPLFFYFVLFQFQLFGLLTALLIPLSIKAPVGINVVSFPGEAYVLIVAVFFIFYSLNKNSFSFHRILKHPVTIMILLDLGWSIFTGLLGESPMISMKRLLIKGAFVIVFYFFFIGLFRQKENLIRVWVLYGIGLILPVLWTLYNHSHYEFNKVVSFEMPPPFYNDHTLYAACIAFILPVIFLVGIKPQWYGLQKKWKFFFLALGVLFFIAEYFSFSRAAWLSIIAAAISGIFIVFLRFKLIHFVVLVIAGTLILSYYSRDIYQNIARVDDVSRKENVDEHFRSMLNIQTDASNLERINRWQCAIRMFQDRPVTGFGPGAYLSNYAKYQVTTEMTRISTNHGEKGNAHSEYLMYLSETGMPGLVIFLIIIFFIAARAIRIFNTSKELRLKWLIFSILIGFISYLVHGLFNSFLDTDKASILFYAAIAAVVSVDLYHSDKLKTASGIVNPYPGKLADLSAKNPGQKI